MRAPFLRNLFIIGMIRLPNRYCLNIYIYIYIYIYNVSEGLFIILEIRQWRRKHEKEIFSWLIEFSDDFVIATNDSAGK